MGLCQNDVSDHLSHGQVKPIFFSTTVVNSRREINPTRCGYQDTILLLVWHLTQGRDNWIWKKHTLSNLSLKLIMSINPSS